MRSREGQPWLSPPKLAENRDGRTPLICWMDHPNERAPCGDSHDAEIRVGTESVQKWLREYEKRNFAQSPVKRRLYAVESVESIDPALYARTLLVAVLEHVPFTGPWLQRKRLEREHKDWARHLRRYLAAQAGTHLPVDPRGASDQNREDRVISGAAERWSGSGRHGALIVHPSRLATPITPPSVAPASDRRLSASA